MRFFLVIAVLSVSLPLAAGAGGTQQESPNPIAARVTADAAAIFNLDSRPSLLLIEKNNGVQAPRVLNQGDEYGQGWRVSDLTAEQVVLSRGTEVVRVSLAALRPPGAAPEASASDVGLGVVNFQSARRAGSPVASGRDEPEILVGITKGNAKKVIAAGGTANEALAAELNGPLAPAYDHLLDQLKNGAGELTFIDYRGRAGLAFVKDGRRGYTMTLGTLGDAPAGAMILGVNPDPPIEMFLIDNGPPMRIETFQTRAARVPGPAP